ncbi:MAG: GAF domain-containing protein [Schleiferiaceae bacterium]|nr:GAF domain-containing protein [Schleiferiaceae bacterium]
MTQPAADGFLQAIQEILEAKTEAKTEKVMLYMQQNIPGYDWVGIYLMHISSQMLHLGPFAGAPTEHTQIPFGKGICGQVAASGKSYLSNDVAAEENYIACSITTKSELVVPVYSGDLLIAQIDIDSHTAANFNAVDEAFLLQLGAWLAPQLLHDYNTLNKTN